MFLVLIAAAAFVDLNQNQANVLMTIAVVAFGANTAAKWSVIREKISERIGRSVGGDDVIPGPEKD